VTKTRVGLSIAAVTCLTLLLAGGVVSSARAGIGDDVCPDANGEDTNTCPPGQVGVFYSITFKLPEGQGCSPGDDVWSIVGGNSPPGLSMSSSGTLAGTPTQAGIFKFFIQMALPDNENCNGTKDTTQRLMTLTVNPAIPRLTLGPESTTPATTGTPYSLQMTASLPDAKTWSITAGGLPPGLAINASTGLISGTPTTAGTYDFTVYAKVNADSRSDTKAPGIVVRSPLVVSAGEPFVANRAQAEVSVPFDATITATGGFGTHTWAVAAGTLPPGLTLVNGAISGTPTTAGNYAFIASVTDVEGRKANFTAHIAVAARLLISTLVLRPGKVGKLYAAKLKTLGGVKPASWRILRGPLPPGIRFDRKLGVLAGVPKKAGRYRVTFEVTDVLGVVSKKTLAIVAAA